jgi:hypothetical protein
MAMEWPELDELKQVLDVTSEDWDGDSDDTRLTRLLEAAIDQTKHDIGLVDDDFVPTAAQSQAALRLAELIALRAAPSAHDATKDPTYRKLLQGSRRVFGFS